MPDPIKILALDVGFCNTGIAVLRHSNKSASCLAAYSIKTDPEAKKRKIYQTDDNVRRIGLIVDELDKVIQTHRPSVVVAELPLSGGQSAKSHFAMAVSMGVTVTVTRLRHLPLFNCCWDDARKVLLGTRASTKTEVQEEIAKRLPELRGMANLRKASGAWNMSVFEHVADALASYFWLIRQDHFTALYQKDKA